MTDSQSLSLSFVADEFRLALRELHPRAAELSENFALAVTTYSVCDFTQVRQLSRELVAALESSLSLAGALDAEVHGELAGVIENARRLHRAIGQDRSLDAARSNKKMSICADAVVRGVETTLDAVDRQTAKADSGILRRPARVTSNAAWLLKCAARLIPAGDRPRFTSEFESELWDMAHAGASWREQMAYAARLVGSAPRLRFALQTHRR